MIRDQKVKDCGHSDTIYGQIRTLGGMFIPAYRMHGHILMKLIAITHYQVHMTPMTFQGHAIKGQHHRHFLKMHFSNRGND